MSLPLDLGLNAERGVTQEIAALERSEDWQKVLTHLEFIGRSSSLVVFDVPDARFAEVCRGVLQGWVRVRGFEIESWVCETVEELLAVPARLAQWTPSESAGLLWISAFPRDAGVWRDVARRLNEFRDRIRKTVPFPLVLAGSGGMIESLRDEAPDLWATRDLVAYLRPESLAAIPASNAPRERLYLSFMGETVTDPGTDYQQALWLIGESGPSEIQDRRVAAASELFQRAARGWMQQADWGRAEDALQRSVRQCEILRHHEGQIRGLLLLSVVHKAQGHMNDAAQVIALASRLSTLAGYEFGLATARGIQADILQLKGEYKEALRIRREEVLPAYQKLGDDHSRLVTLGKIADIHEAMGEYDVALRIRQQEELPAYERLGDIRARAVVSGKIADIHQARGEYEEALRIYRNVELPAYERTGDLRSRAVTLGNIADVHYSRGQYDEALRIYQEEELPVYEKLRDVRSRAVTLGKIADIHQVRGEYDEALRIHLEEELPIYKQLGDLRASAMTLEQIAGIHQERREYHQALRILREEALPIFEKLGDVRSRAITLGKIAIALSRQGSVSEAINAFERDALPVHEAMGNAALMAQAGCVLADMYLARNEPGDAARARQLLDRAHEIASRLGLKPWLEDIDALRRRAG